MSDILENYEAYLEILSELGEDAELSSEEFDALSEEELLELSKKTLKSYQKKATTSADRAWAKADKEEDKAMATDGEKYPEKQARHNANAAKAVKTWGKRDAGLKMVNKKLKEDEDMELDETTQAAASIATHPVGKADAMAHLLGHMNSMSKGEAIDFFHKVMGQFGPGKEYGVGDNSDKNSATIDTKLGAGPKTADPMPKITVPLAKINVKEDLDAVFDGQELSEEFKETASTLFEAAVSARVIAETSRLEEEYEVKLQEELATLGEEITNQIDMYMTYATENWMKENAVAIESTLRNEIMEDFMEGLKNLFAEHYIDVPEDKVDVLEAMAEKVDALESKLDETISENAELRGFVVESYKKDIFEDISSDLALTQQEKFAALAEGIEFDGDLDVYANKLLIIKENYFKNESSSTSNISEEVFEGDVAEVRNIDPLVNRYAQALARTVKK